MRRCNLDFTPTCFQLLLITLFMCYCYVTAFSPNQTVNSLTDDVCENVDCGQGICRPSSSLIGFDCDCNPGWKTIQIGFLSFPSCVIPNCTIDFGCGNGAPPPPPPPPPPPVAPLPRTNLLSTCNFVWCGDGTCVVNGEGHICKCNEGSANLFNVSEFACFKQCYFGADCSGLSVGQSPQTSDSGSEESSNVFSNPRPLPMMWMVASFFLWV